MKVSLKTQAKESEWQQVAMTLTERLPIHINTPCQVTCDYHVKACDNYYLLTLHVQGEVEVTCQRCLQTFPHHYDHQSQLAICSDDTIAERLMEQYESIVALNNQIDLTEILTDELYLFPPEKHLDPSDCDKDMNELINCSLDEA